MLKDLPWLHHGNAGAGGVDVLQTLKCLGMAPGKTSKANLPVALQRDGGGEGVFDVVVKSMEMH